MVLNSIKPDAATAAADESRWVGPPVAGLRSPSPIPVVEL
jgi:hypothetical protein